MNESNKRIEYYDGAAKVMPETYPDINIVQNNLYRLLTWRYNIYTSGVAIKLAKADGSTYKLLPKLFVVPNDDSFNKEGIYEGAPLFVIEIFDKNTEDRYKEDKLDIYSLCNVPAYWIIDMDKRAITIKLNNENGKYTESNTYTYGDIIKWITGAVRVVDIFKGIRSIPDYKKGIDKGIDIAIDIISLYKENNSVPDIAAKLDINEDNVSKIVKIFHK